MGVEPILTLNPLQLICNLMKFKKNLFLFALFITFAFSLQAHGKLPYLLFSEKVTKGEALLLTLDARKRKDLKEPIYLKYNKKKIKLKKHPFKIQGIYYAMLGISYWSKPQKTALTLEWRDKEGLHRQKVPFQIIGGKYRKEKIRVKRSKIKPKKSLLKKAARDAKRVKKLLASEHPVRLWRGKFLLPVDNPFTTSPYGSSRIFNGQVRSYHNGLDLRAPKGTPIRNSNSGRVSLVRDLLYSGKTVLVDHGLGIFSGYSHLSKTLVKTGQWLPKGKVLGLAGATGRVTGPHLHWGITVNGVKVSPLQFQKAAAYLMSRRSIQFR